MAAIDLTAARVRELFHYHPETGIFIRKVKTCAQVEVGGIAGSLAKDGYLRIKVDGYSYKASRLAWLYVTGGWPVFQVDHKDGDKANDRFLNLRDVRQQVNIQNQRAPRRHKRISRLMGVTKREGRWVARIDVGGTRKHLGAFATEQAAHEVYLEAKRRLHEGCTL